MRNKLLGVVLLLFLAFNVSAGVFSIDRGSWYTFGSLSIEKGFAQGYDSFETSIDGGLHLFLFNRLSLGIAATFTHYSYFGKSYNNGVGYIETEYFLGEKAGTIFPFFGLAIGAGTKNYGAVDFNFVGAKVGGGLNLMLNDRVGLRLGANYYFDKVKASVENDGSRIKLYMGFLCFLY